jgi:GntR family transcriptional regulator/MocR family aminotransferase
MAQSSTNSLAGEFLLELDKHSTVAMHAQIEARVRDAIRSGRLPAGTAVPPSRQLADELGLSRGVVVEAYQQLTAEGYLVSQVGSFTRVAPGVARNPTSTATSAPAASSALIDFRYGQPDVTQFPRAAWLRSLRRALIESPHDRFTYRDGRGADELRVALSDYLNRVRGTWTSPDNMVVCNGFAQAISLITWVLAARGITTLAVEDPSDHESRRAAQEAGLRVVGIPVTADGIDVARLEASGADAVLVTPAHQFPTGALLGPEQRAALVAWARARDAIIIEDDYDAEYRYDGTPVGSLQGLAPDHVIYAGTASKTLAPGLRMGWMIVPPHLVAAVAQRKREVDRGSPVIEQLALADFVSRGELDRHLRKMRPLYRARRDVLLEALGAALPELEPVGIAGGIHVFAWLPPHIRPAAIVPAALDRGLVIEGMGDYRMSGERDGLIFGYGKLDDDAIHRGVAILADAVATLDSGG